ncbi:hypothetical protein DJ010_08785 [Nocardioides silvaticus]|uniref:Uncharacterized protein n=1 Tax=Nocardioides silvaticus TaxID=2201891 RepID=A0A316TUR7_9ACTN|nr:hypothetical protein [Nocardioides silvaticus]PWN03206.1 hypothetical protein DJ010_08785 [Nocardioides silvaticus]
MGDWIPLLVRREDYAELAALVAQREVGRPDRPLGSVVSTDVPYAVPVPGVGPVPPAAAAAPAAPVVELTPAERAEAEQLARLVPWSTTELKRLATSPALLAHRWRMVLDACSSRPGGFFADERIAPLTATRPEEWAETRAAMGRFLETNFADAPGAPVVVAGGATLRRSDTQDWWAVTEEQADRWREVRGALPKGPRPAPLPVPSILD